MREQLFPDAHTEGREFRAASAWDFRWPLPVPRFELGCGHCPGRYVLKGWKFHSRSRTGSKTPWRCDVKLKCMTCGHVPIFGVAVPARLFHQSHKQGWIEWREGRRLLAAAGFFEEG